MFIHKKYCQPGSGYGSEFNAVLQYSIEVPQGTSCDRLRTLWMWWGKSSDRWEYHGLIDKWLRNIQKVSGFTERNWIIYSDEEKKHRKLVELVVREQVYNLAMTTIYQKALKKGENIQLHGWVYDISKGHIKDLDIDLKKDFKRIRHL